MLQILDELYQSSRQELEYGQEDKIKSLKELAEQHAYRVSIDDVQQKQYMKILQQKASLLIKKELDEVKDLVDLRNENTFNKICSGEVEIVKNETNLASSKMTQSKVLLTQSVVNKSHIFDDCDEQKKKALIKQLLKKKQEEKAERHSRLDKILEKETEAMKIKREEQQKIKTNMIWIRNQKSLEKYRLSKQRYQEQEIDKQSRLQTIREFHHKLRSISKKSEKDFASLDVQRNKELQSSRTEALIQRKKQLKVDYRDIDEHGQKYMQKLKAIQSDRLSRFQQRKSEDINAMKLIQPFTQVYISKDEHKEAQQKLIKMKQFKEHVKLHIRPTIDVEKRKQLLNSIISEDSNRYRSLGIMKQEVNGKIIEKQLPKINLRAIGNQYMRHAKKMKSTMEHRTEILQEEPTQVHKATNYLIDLKREERRRMSKSEEIERSQVPIKEKIKRIHISIQCLENEIKKHKTLMRNSSGLPSDKVDELQEAVDTKNHQISNLKLTLMSLLERD